MDSNKIWGWVALGIIILIAIQLLKGVLSFLGGVIHIAISAAIIIGIIWLLVSLFGRRRSSY